MFPGAEQGAQPVESGPLNFFVLDDGDSPVKLCRNGESCNACPDFEGVAYAKSESNRWNEISHRNLFFLCLTMAIL